jgi:2'-5' RNA ligase
MEKDLFEALTVFSSRQEQFTIHLKNFSNFAPKVIFIDVVPNQSLEDLWKNVNAFLVLQNKFPLKKDDRPFHPHITLANRDLYKKAFIEAWQKFSGLEYEAAWHANSVSLLGHNKNNWEVLFTGNFPG